MKTFDNVSVVGEEGLSIKFIPRVGCNMINGIEIGKPVANQAPTVNAGPDQTITSRFSQPDGDGFR